MTVGDVLGCITLGVLVLLLVLMIVFGEMEGPG